MKYTFFILILSFLLSSCGPSLYSPDDLSKVYIGMPYDEFEKIYDEDGENVDYVKVDGIKYKISRHWFTNYIYVVSDGDGETHHHYKDAFYLVFDNDTLMDLGYPYEFKRSEDGHYQRLGDALSQTIIPEN